MNKIAAVIVVLIGSCFISEKGSTWFGNTFIYTQAMRDSDERAKEMNKRMMHIAAGIDAATSEINNYGR